jgi:hypothetical protein
MDFPFLSRDPRPKPVAAAMGEGSIKAALITRHSTVTVLPPPAIEGFHCS